jgi:hypothetical protein
VSSQKTVNLSLYVEIEIVADSREEAYEKWKAMWIAWWTECMNQKENNIDYGPPQMIPGYFAKIRSEEKESKPTDE